MLSGPSFIPNVCRNGVILCHGYGSDGADMAGLFPALRAALPETAFFAPNAPIQTAPDSYEWFSLDDYTGPDRLSVSYAETLVGRCHQPAEELRAYLNEIKQRYAFAESQLVLGGFSQGGLMAAYTALTHPTPVAGVIGFSAVPIVFGHQLPLEYVSSTMPVLLTHGGQDDVIPTIGMTLNETQLRRAGCSVQTCISPDLPHAIDSLCLTTAARFIRTVFSAKRD